MGAGNKISYTGSNVKAPSLINKSYGSGYVAFDPLFYNKQSAGSYQNNEFLFEEPLSWNFIPRMINH
jgi:hypothetical protein